LKYLQLFETRMTNAVQLAKLGLVDEDTAKVYKYLEEVNDPERFSGWLNLNLEDYPHESLPPELVHVKGELNLIDAKIKSLPDGFKVDGDLSLHGSSIEALPKGLEVGRDLHLDDTGISFLPDDLKVGGSLTLAATPNLTQLPQRMDVASLPVGSRSVFNTESPSVFRYELRLGDSEIKTLPENFHVTGNLDLSGSHIEDLPEGLRVDGDLYIRYSNVDLDRLPSRMSVAGDMLITRNQWMSMNQRTRDRLSEMVNGDIEVS